MEHVGDPAKRPMPAIGDPVEYARDHRAEILGELLGMLLIWKEKGCRSIQIPCRFRAWAAMINGILVANGFNDFLSTYGVDAREGDERQSAFEELALARPNEFLRPGDWLAETLRLRLYKDQLRDKSERGRQTVIGTLLKGCVGREILVQDIDGKSCQIFRLKCREGRNGMLYGFMKQPESPATSSE